MKDGIVPLMFLLGRPNAVTELLMQVISGQLQWLVEFAERVQWLMEDGFCQYCFRLIKIACS